MRLVKRIAALGLAAMVTVGLTACHVGQDTNWVAEVNGEKVAAGIYLEKLLDAYHAQVSKLTQEGEEPPKKPLNEQIDGKRVSDLVTEEARSNLNRYLAIEQKFAEMNLTVEPEAQQYIDSFAEQYWGWIGTSYKENGISVESFKASMLNDQAKRGGIFNALYGKGGTEEIPDNELQEKFYSDFAKIVLISYQLGTEEDAAAKEASDTKAREAIEKYYQQAVGGGNMEDIYYEAKKEGSEDPESIEKPEAAEIYKFVNRNESQYDEKVTNAIFEAALNTPTKVETDEAVYMFVRYDIKENPDEFESNRNILMHLLRDDAFEAKLTEWSGSLSGITFNDAALKRYTPDKLKV